MKHTEHFTKNQTWKILSDLEDWLKWVVTEFETCVDDIVARRIMIMRERWQSLKFYKKEFGIYYKEFRDLVDSTDILKIDNTPQLYPFWWLLSVMSDRQMLVWSVIFVHLSNVKNLIGAFSEDSHVECTWHNVYNEKMLEKCRAWEREVHDFLTLVDPMWDLTSRTQWVSLKIQDIIWEEFS